MKERKQKLTHKIRCYGYLNIRYSFPLLPKGMYHPRYKKLLPFIIKRGHWKDPNREERSIWWIYLPSKKIKFHTRK